MSIPPIPFRDGIGLGLTALRAECCRRHSARSRDIVQDKGAGARAYARCIMKRVMCIVHCAARAAHSLASELLRQVEVLVLNEVVEEGGAGGPASLLGPLVASHSPPALVLTSHACTRATQRTRKCARAWYGSRMWNHKSSRSGVLLQSTS